MGHRSLCLRYTCGMVAEERATKLLSRWPRQGSECTIVVEDRHIVTRDGVREANPCHETPQINTSVI